jgi:hypothetical protein
MKIKCINLTHQLIESRLPAVGDFQFPTDYRDFLTIGKVYSVYGFSIFKNNLYYLIDNPLEGWPINPDWYPVEIFEVVDSSLPKEMYFGYFGSNDKRGVNALWGYKELVHDYSHYEGLVEIEEDAIRVFQKRKEEIDSQI